MAEIEAYPNPRMLRWARESSRVPVQEVADKVGVATQVLQAWESGEDRPTVQQLRHLGRVYRRPFALFFLPSVPADFTVMHDFRRPVGADEALSAGLAFEIRVAHARREDAVELAASLGEEAAPFSLRVSRADSVGANAAAVRGALGVSTVEQREWKDSYAALRTWVRAVETLGVLVFQPDGLPEDEVRGFSIHATAFPVIVLNGGDYPRGRIFTLIHELIHLSLHEAGVCNLRESRKAGQYNSRTERFCNRVAAEVLVPTGDLLKDELVRSASLDGEWSDEGINIVAKRFNVSKEVMLRRLVEVGKASSELYRAKRPDFVAAYRRNREFRRGSGGPPPARMALRRVGNSFADLVLEAYSRDLIPTSDLPDYFGVRLKHLPKLYEELRRWPNAEA